MRHRKIGALLALCVGCGSSNGGSDPDGDAGGSGGSVMGGSGGNVTGGMGGSTTGGMAGGGATGGGGAGGTGATGATGGTGGGSSGTGGQGGSSGGAPSAGHCAPGETFEEGAIDADRAFGGLAIFCTGALHTQGIENGIGDDGNGWVTVYSLLLDAPTAAGVETAISVEIESSDGGETGLQLEYWAAESECGSSGALERFYAEPVNESGVHCASFTPTQAYPYILEVLRPLPDVTGGGASRGAATVCMAGGCPAP